MNPKNTPPAGTKTHKPNCGCPICKRVQGRQEPTGQPRVGGLPAPIAVPSIAEAHELANNPKALELSSEVAAQKRTIERPKSERIRLTEELTEAKGLAKSRQETIQGRNKELQELKATRAQESAFLILWRKAAKDALFDLSSGGADTTPDDPAIIAEGLKDATRLATETAAQVEMLCRLIGISSDPTPDWVENAARAVNRLEWNAAEGARWPLEQERNTYKALSELQASQLQGVQESLKKALLDLSYMQETEDSANAFGVWLVAGVTGLLCAVFGLWVGMWLVGGRS